MKKPKIKISGLLNVNKPVGHTSHDMVAEARKITGERKIGHTGTLDPFASGVMVLCLGHATKLSASLMNTRKTYFGRMHLGVRTDTQDKTGEVIATANSVDINESTLKKVFAQFTGEIEQIPPMYSAVKHKGERLYKLARKGIVVERQPKQVTIYRLEIKNIDGFFVDFVAETSPGTYIRTLCDSMGEVLGVGAHLAELSRTRVGIYDIKNALTITNLKEVVQKGELDSVLVPLDKIPGPTEGI